MYIPLLFARLFEILKLVKLLAVQFSTKAFFIFAQGFASTKIICIGKGFYGNPPLYYYINVINVSRERKVC